MQVRFPFKHILLCLLFADSLAAQNPPNPTTGEVTELKEIVVTADRDEPKLYDPTNFGGTRLDVPLREVPQSIRVVTNQQLQDITAVRMQDAFEYVSGVSLQNNFGGGLWENYAVRGFTGDANNAGLAYLVNGFPANRGFNGPRDTVNVENIEFLKGPSAALFGAGDPGGTINVTTKKPLWEWHHSMQSMIGSFDFFRQTFDSSGPLTDTFAYRLNYAYEDANSFRDFIGSSRNFYSGAFTWKITENTTLEYFGEYLSALSDFDRGVFALNRGTAAQPNFQLGAVPDERFFGEPDDEPMQNRNHTSQLRLTHKFDEDWFVRLGAAYKQNSLFGYSSETRDVNATTGLMRRRYRLRDYDSQDWDIQAEIGGKITTGPLEHTLLVGMETYWFETDQILRSGNYATRLDIYNPVYGQAKPALTTTVWDRTETQQGFALFYQDLISIGKHWNILLGARHDRYRQRMLDRVASRTTFQDDSAWSPRAAITWLPTDTISFYTSFSQSFRPNAGTDMALNTFDPERGRAVEFGMKYQSQDGRLGATLAIFDIQKRNVLRFDPADISGVFLLNGGQVNSRGIEFDMSGSVTDSLRISASLTYQHVKYDETEAFTPGGQLLNIPSINASLLAVQEFDLGRYGRLGIGGGGIYVGERTGNEHGTLDLPDYITFKVLSYWQATKNVRVTFDVENLFDQQFYASSVNQNIIQPGAPRTLMLGVQLTF